MSQKVMIVAGGKWQLPLIKKCQDKGFLVINTNLYSDTEGAKQADIFVRSDILDVESNVQVAKHYLPDAILTDQSDMAVPTVAALCEVMAKPGIGTECAARFTNKYLMRKFAQKAGIPVPDFSLANRENAHKVASEIGYPVVVKPLSSQGSRGVKAVFEECELLHAIENALEFSEQSVLIEKFIDGIEYTVEGFKDNIKHTTLAISEKKAMRETPSVAQRMVYRSKFTDIDQVSLKAQNDQLIASFGLPFGITHAEYKYADGAFYLIEVAARGGGNNVSSTIIPTMTGVDVNDLLIEYALGNEPKLELLKEPERQSKYVLLTWLLFSPGKTIRRTEEQEVKALPGVVDFSYNFEIGDNIDKVINDASRHSYIIIEASNEQQLFERFQHAERIVNVETL